MVQFFKKSKKEEEIKTSVQPKPRAAAAAATILEAMADGVAIADIKGNIIQCNTGFVKMFGFKNKNEVAGVTVMEVLAEKEIPRVMAEFEKSFKTGGTINIEFIGKDRGGKEFPVMINSKVLKDEKGNIVGEVGVIRDITELKKSQEELQNTVTRLRASEQQLKAANLQLNAANQQLGAAQKNLQDKLLELERFNKVAVGRELKMVELKEEIARLKDGTVKTLNPK